MARKLTPEEEAELQEQMKREADRAYAERMREVTSPNYQPNSRGNEAESGRKNGGR